MNCSLSNDDYNLKCESLKCSECTVTFVLTNVENNSETFLLSNGSDIDFSFIKIKDTCSSYELEVYISKEGFDKSDPQFYQELIG